MLPASLCKDVLREKIPVSVTKNAIVSQLKFTLMTPREIWERAPRLSYNGYSTTVIAEQKHQMIPMTTHAVSPRTPKMVLAKKSGPGIKMSMIRV